MRIHNNIWEAIQQWIWPTYQPTVVNYYHTEYGKTHKEPEPMPNDPHTQFVGYNPDGHLVKATTLPFVDDNSTDFATIRAYNKTKPVMQVTSALTAEDTCELAKRKPVVTTATATVLKAIFADKGGSTTADELSTISGYSKSYCAAALAAFRAALPRE